MERHEILRLQYRNRRYMQHLTIEELRQRSKDVFLNVLVITNAAKIGLPPINEEGNYWFIQWTHVLEEFVIRFGPYPAGFEDNFLQVPYSDFSLLDSAASAMKKQGVPQGKYLVKYGKLKFLKHTFEFGQIRISPATYYNDQSLNPAIQDNELELAIQPPSSELRMEVFDRITRKKKATIKPKWNKISEVCQTNYYVYCLSMIFAPRLFHDFDHADSCLIISKPKDFIERLCKKFMHTALDFIVIANQVKYIDPLNTKSSDIDLFFCKNFRYAYQKEFRIVWVPKENRHKLDHIHITLDDIQNMCELIVL